MSEENAVTEQEPEQAQEPVQSLKLDVAVTQPSACERHVTVTIPREDVDRYFGDAVSRLMHEAHVPGFRAGRAPRKVVENHFRTQLNDEVKGKLLLDAMTQVTDEQSFSAISEPDFDFAAVKVPESGPLTFEFDVEVRPEFKLPKWKGLKIERPHREFSEADVDRHLGRVLEQVSAYLPANEPAKLDDFLATDIVVSRNGVETSSHKDVEIRVRPVLEFPDCRLENFDSLAVGCLPGSELRTTVTLSEHADDPSLRGEKMEVAFKVQDVTRVVAPELTEDILSKMGNFENVGELRDAVRRELERQLRYHQDRKVRAQITELLTESASWDLPPGLLKRQASREMDRALMELRASGFADDEVNAYINSLRRDSSKSTARALKEHFILERIAEDEVIDATEEDYERELSMMAFQSGESPRAVRARIEKRNNMDVLRNQIIERKVLDLVLSNAKVMDVPYKFQDDREAAVSVHLGGTNVSHIPEAKYEDAGPDISKTQDRPKMN